MKKLVLMRHGESQWNLENRFTGWTDVDLTEKGEAEAKNCGLLLREAGFQFDIVAVPIETLSIIMDSIVTPTVCNPTLYPEPLFPILID